MSILDNLRQLPFLLLQHEADKKVLLSARDRHTAVADGMLQQDDGHHYAALQRIYLLWRSRSSWHLQARHRHHAQPRNL